MITGRATESASGALTQPLPLELKEGRAGLGVDEQRKREREQQEQQVGGGGRREGGGSGKGALAVGGELGGRGEQRQQQGVTRRGGMSRAWGLS